MCEGAAFWFQVVCTFGPHLHQGEVNSLQNPIRVLINNKSSDKSNSKATATFLSSSFLSRKWKIWLTWKSMDFLQAPRWEPAGTRYSTQKCFKKKGCEMPGSNLQAVCPMSRVVSVQSGGIRRFLYALRLPYFLLGEELLLNLYAATGTTRLCSVSELIRTTIQTLNNGDTCLSSFIWRKNPIDTGGAFTTRKWKNILDTGNVGWNRSALQGVHSFILKSGRKCAAQCHIGNELENSETEKKICFQHDDGL